ncbi:MAG TPA: transporter [Clostridiales bacterium]|nr:transporter [Clostridiales bacterium]
MPKKTVLITQAAVIAAAYIVLTLPFAQIAFGGPIQFRLAEALAVLATLTPAAIPGLFLGCLLANWFNPQSLGLIDIIFGSLATLIAAWLTWHIFRASQGKPVLRKWATLLALLPPVLVNALMVGFYLPFLLPDTQPGIPVIAGFMLSIALSQTLVVYGIGWPLLLGLRRTKLNYFTGN